MKRTSRFHASDAVGLRLNLPIACSAIWLALTPSGAVGATTNDEQVFKLREVSVFERGTEFTRGQSVTCEDKASPEVKAYPKFNSRKPMYGSVRFARKARDSKSGQLFHFAVDESRGTGKGYDRFYFDYNQDLDLSKESAVAPHRQPPEQARLNYGGIKEQVLFAHLMVPFRRDAGETCMVEIMPRLLAMDYGSPQITFVRTTLCEGDIQIAGKEFTVRLGNDYFINGPLDAAGTALKLTPKGTTNERAPYWWGGDRLRAMHVIAGDWYTFAASPLGHELRVRPFRGDVGRFEVGAGDRKLTNLVVNGSLEAPNCSVAVGPVTKEGWPQPVAGCQLPVGDYLASLMSVGFGRLQISLSYNYHSDGKPSDRSGRPVAYAFAIRKDRPFVLDFSNAPEVMFASPAQDQQIKLGDALQVKAVLVDPKLDVMIRGLTDTTRRQTKDANGRPVNDGRNLSLDPTVLVTRTNGEKVAEGVMPFG